METALYTVRMHRVSYNQLNPQCSFNPSLVKGEHAQVLFPCFFGIDKSNPKHHWLERLSELYCVGRFHAIQRQRGLM